MIKKYIKKTLLKKLGISEIHSQIHALKTETKKRKLEIKKIKNEFHQARVDIDSLKNIIEFQHINLCNQQTTQRIKNKIENNQKINIMFLVIHSSVWQYDDLYKKYFNDKNCNVKIVIAPYTIYGKNDMVQEMNQSFTYFKNKKYNVVKGYDDKEDKYINIKTEFQPDIVFFTNPHKITTDDFYINNFFENSLTCYVPYGIMLTNTQQSQFNQPFHNQTWKNFYETNITYNIAKEYSKNKGSNIVVAGYPKCDVFLNKRYQPKNVWKNSNNSLKKIIWAPHHTIEIDENKLGYSNFLNYHQIMLDLAKKYQNKIQFAFKPHPLLFNKLKLHANWGEKKANQYYDKWSKGNNTQLELNEYTDLFLSSDSMIMDSVSFITEYMYTNKPSLFMIRDKTIDNKFNEFGKMAFSLLYKSKNNKELTDFIEKVVLGEKDDKKNQRENFINKHLIPPNNQTATDNIYYFIQNHLK